MGRRTALRRHQTLRATLDWSYALLFDADRAVLRQLSIFADGFTVAAASAVIATVEIPFSVALRSCERFPDRCASRNYLPGSGHPLRKHSEKCRITRDRSGLAKLTESVVEKPARASLRSIHRGVRDRRSDDGKGAPRLFAVTHGRASARAPALSWGPLLTQAQRSACRRAQRHNFNYV